MEATEASWQHKTIQSQEVTLPVTTGKVTVEAKVRNSYENGH